MPPKRRKFESTFPAARIKKIMQLDDDVGRVASSVPVVISRAVEIFLQALLTRGAVYATSRNAKTLTVGHLKHCIEQEKQWDFLKELTAKISDIAAQEDDEEATAPKRGRKRQNSPPPSTSGQQPRPAKKKRKAVAAASTDGKGSGSSEEDSTNTSDQLVGRGMFSQYFKQPSSSSGGSSRSNSVASTSPLNSDSKQPSTSSHPHPPSLLSLSSHPPSLAAPAGTSTSLSAMTAGLHRLTGDNTAEEDEEEDYDA